VSRKPSRPSPRIRLLPRPPLTFEAFSDLLKAIGQGMDELGVAYEVSSDYEVANEGNVVTLRDPTGLAVMTFDLQTFRS
jgi:hypothetical protein